MKYYTFFIVMLIVCTVHAENQETSDSMDSLTKSNSIGVGEESEIVDNSRDSEAMLEYLKNAKRRSIQQQLHYNQE